MRVSAYRIIPGNIEDDQQLLDEIQAELQDLDLPEAEDDLQDLLDVSFEPPDPDADFQDRLLDDIINLPVPDWAEDWPDEWIPEVILDEIPDIPEIPEADLPIDLREIIQDVPAPRPFFIPSSSSSDSTVPDDDQPPDRPDVPEDNEIPADDDSDSGPEDTVQRLIYGKYKLIGDYVKKKPIPRIVHTHQTRDMMINSVINDGYRFKVAEKYTPLYYKTPESKVMTELVQHYVAEGVLEVAEEKPVRCHRMYTIGKPDRSIRPIYDMSPTTPYLTPPKFKLPKVQEALDADGTRYYYTKIDISDAFLHIPIAESHRKHLGLYYKGTYYRFTRMPFGHACGPFIAQRFYSSIVRSFTSLWFKIYIDDILLRHTDPEILRRETQKLIESLEAIGIPVNRTKSVTDPTINIKYLGLYVNSELGTIKLGYKRKRFVYKLLQRASIMVLDYKQTQRIKGYVLFIAQALRWPLPCLTGDFDTMLQYAQRYLLELDTYYAYTLHHETLYTDASLTDLGAYYNGCYYNIQYRTPHIFIGEFKAVQFFVEYFIPKDTTLDIFVDNIAVMYVIKHRNCHVDYFRKTVERFLVMCRKCNIHVNIQYVSTCINPADRATRLSGHKNLIIAEDADWLD